MKETLIHLILGISLFGWGFIGISPENIDYIFNFPNQRQCADFLGSALYQHANPRICHNHPNPIDCKAIGPSIAVQQGWSFSNICIQDKKFGFLPH